MGGGRDRKGMSELTINSNTAPFAGKFSYFLGSSEISLVFLACELITLPLLPQIQLILPYEISFVKGILGSDIPIYNP